MSVQERQKKKLSKENAMEDEEVKHYAFIKNDRRYYDPQILSGGETTVRWIFPVPESNAVGTLDAYTNGIVLIIFGDYATMPKYKGIAKDYGRRIYNLFYYRFSPNYTDDRIVYSQDRIAIVANVKTGEVFNAKCDFPDGSYMLGIRFLNPQKELFVIVKSIRGAKPYDENFLYTVKLEDQDFIDTGWSIYIGEERYTSEDVPLHNKWFVHNNTLLAYDQERNQIRCTDGEQSVLHPFSETFNANTGRIGKVKDFVIHPKLQFGVIIVESAPDTHDLLVLRWDISNPKKWAKQIISLNQALKMQASLLGMDRLRLAYQSFSPDGSWYVVGILERVKLSGPQNPHFIAIPVTSVNKKQPYFLDVDNLVALGEIVGLTSIAWTHDPTSYVVSNGELLHKWDLDELPNARVFEVPDDGDGRKRASIFQKIGRLFGGRR